MTRVVESGIKSDMYEKPTSGSSSLLHPPANQSVWPILLPLILLSQAPPFLSNPAHFKVFRKFKDLRHKHELNVKRDPGGWWREQSQERPQPWSQAVKICFELTTKARSAKRVRTQCREKEREAAFHTGNVSQRTLDRVRSALHPEEFLLSCANCQHPGWEHGLTDLLSSSREVLGQSAASQKQKISK